MCIKNYDIYDSHPVSSTPTIVILVSVVSGEYWLMRHRLVTVYNRFCVYNVSIILSHGPWKLPYTSMRRISNSALCSFVIFCLHKKPIRGLTASAHLRQTWTYMNEDRGSSAGSVALLFAKRPIHHYSTYSRSIYRTNIACKSFNYHRIENLYNQCHSTFQDKFFKTKTSCIHAMWSDSYAWIMKWTKMTRRRMHIPVPHGIEKEQHRKKGACKGRSLYEDLNSQWGNFEDKILREDLRNRRKVLTHMTPKSTRERPTHTQALQHEENILTRPTSDLLSSDDGTLKI